MRDLVRAVAQVVTARTVRAAWVLVAAPSCACGCEPLVHEHYRAGRDCGRCGPSICPEYRRSWRFPR